MQPRTPSDSQSLLVRRMGYEDAEPGGFVHGGVRRRNRLAEREEILAARDPA